MLGVHMRQRRRRRLCSQSPFPPHSAHRLGCLRWGHRYRVLPHSMHVPLRRLCLHSSLPPSGQRVHRDFFLPCPQSDSGRHTGQVQRRRWWGQMPLPPHGTHMLRCRPCSHFHEQDNLGNGNVLIHSLRVTTMSRQRPLAIFPRRAALPPRFGSILAGAAEGGGAVGAGVGAGEGAGVGVSGVGVGMSVAVGEAGEVGEVGEDGAVDAGLVPSSRVHSRCNRCLLVSACIRCSLPSSATSSCSFFLSANAPTPNLPRPTPPLSSRASCSTSTSPRDDV